MSVFADGSIKERLGHISRRRTGECTQITTPVPLFQVHILHSPIPHSPILHSHIFHSPIFHSHITPFKHTPFTHIPFAHTFSPTFHSPYSIFHTPFTHSPFTQSPFPGTRYLVQEKRRSRALDPVAHFHLSGGASVWRLNWLADLSPLGLQNSCGIMCNYHYCLQQLNVNSDSYRVTGRVARSDSVQALLNRLD